MDIGGASGQQRSHSDILSPAIHKKSEALNLLCLATRISAVENQVEMAVTTCQVMGSMTSVVKGMCRAMKMMVLEYVRPAPPSLKPPSS